MDSPDPYSQMIHADSDLEHCILGYNDFHNLVMQTLWWLHSWFLASNQSGTGMKEKCRCRNQSRIGIRGPSPVPGCPGTGLRYRVPECRCRRHRPRFRCPAMLDSMITWSVDWSNWKNPAKITKNSGNTFIINVLMYPYEGYNKFNFFKKIKNTDPLMGEKFKI
jgi:hypothetical protein